MKRLLWVVALMLGGCSSGSTATLKLMDAPPQGVTAVEVTVASMDVHVAGDDGEGGDGGWSSLEVGRAIDLVAHQGESAAEVLGKLDLPAGKITQIRLVLDTSDPSKNTATVDGAERELDVSRVDAKGVKINHPFQAIASEGGAEIEVLVDFRLEDSLKPKGDCLELLPVLHLEKVRVDGEDAEL